MSNSILANVLRASHKSTHLMSNSSSVAGTNIKVEYIHSIDKKIALKSIAMHTKDAQTIRDVIKDME